MEAAVNSASVPELDLKVIADRDASLMLGNSQKIEGFWTVHEQSPSFDSPRRFEDLVTWQRARTLTNLVYARCTEQSFIRDFPLMSQMRRAAVSIMSNIAEGNERDGIPEYLHALSIAKGSCAELRSQLHVALDQRYVNESEYAELHRAILEVGRLLKRLQQALSQSKTRKTSK